MISRLQNAPHPHAADNRDGALKINIGSNGILICQIFPRIHE